MKISRLVVCLVMGSLALSAGDLKKQGELNLFGGGVHLSQSFLNVGTKGIVGGSVGYGITSRAQIFGEYSFVPIGSVAGVDLSMKTQLFTGGVKMNVFSKDRVDVYGLAGFGGARSSANSVPSETDSALHLGGGARIYVGKNWGITPELRYIRIFVDGADVNAVSYTGGIFFRFGGRN